MSRSLMTRPKMIPSNKQLTKLSPELIERCAKANALPGSVHHVVGLNTTHDFDGRVTQIVLKMKPRNNVMPDAHDILNYGVAYILFNDGEGTCYRTTDKDSHSSATATKYDDLTSALDAAIKELRAIQRDHIRILLAAARSLKLESDSLENKL